MKLCFSLLLFREKLFILFLLFFLEFCLLFCFSQIFFRLFRNFLFNNLIFIITVLLDFFLVILL
ncbi:MAG: hypothetical protein E7555_02960 [Ruminococcaceae bacterium]|nr:hypothetical protein [Oscillospiraceae bacterium]